MAKSKHDEINPYWILRTAKMDKVSADMLYEKFIQLMCSEDEKENFASVSFSNSAIILYALCVEHGLKAILHRIGIKQISGHNLKELFQSLPVNIQQSVKDALPEDRFKITFDKYLDENKNAFVEWRYSYEQSLCASSDFLKAFSEAIIKVAGSL